MVLFGLSDGAHSILSMVLLGPSKGDPPFFQRMPFGL